MASSSSYVTRRSVTRAPPRRQWEGRTRGRRDAPPTSGGGEGEGGVGAGLVAGRTGGGGGGDVSSGPSSGPGGAGVARGGPGAVRASLSPACLASVAFGSLLRARRGRWWPAPGPARPDRRRFLAEGQPGPVSHFPAAAGFFHCP